MLKQYIKYRLKKEANNEPLEHPAQLRIIQTEEFRTLRTNIEFAQINGKIKSLLITSSIHDEGKTTISTNLAHVMAQTRNKNILIVDTDLRNPSVHHAFGMKNVLGLTSLLLDDTLAIEDVVETSEGVNLSILTSGPIPPSPSELLSSNQMNKLMTDLTEKFDLIIYDTPPLTLVTDAVLLVVRENYTKKKDLVYAKKELDAVEANILGQVLKDAHKNKKRYYYNQYSK